MFVFNTKEELEHYLESFRGAGQTIGLVPTMGAIHQGHLSLIAQSNAENNCTVVSVFVNPTQFNNPTDLEKYPRDLDKDIQTISGLNQEVVIFAPSVLEMYPEDAVSESFDFQGIEQQMEGAQRPGHFDGVGTIVKKLFELVRPTKAYFGEKDFQQLQIIRKLVQTQKMDIQIIGCPIYRAADGLAMSSRNERLSKEALAESTFIFKVLSMAKERFKNQEVEKVQDFVESEFKNNSNFELEYFTIADEQTLQTITEKEEGKSYRGFLVAHIEGVRLIDNMSFN